MEVQYSRCIRCVYSRLTVSVELNIGYVSRNEIVINMVIYCVAQDLKLHLLINHLASTHFSVSLVVAKS